MAKQIKVSANQYTLVDDDFFDALKKIKWDLTKLGYAAHITYKNGTPVSTLLHRYLMGDPIGKEVDHKDGNRLNNQLSNLRIATHSQNQCNHKLISRNTTGYSGVFKSPNKKRFCAQIKSNGKQTHLGTFDTAEEAARVRDRAAIKYHKEFARLNFPQDGN